MKKGMSLEKCVNKTEEYISEQRICYLAFDVIGSKKMDRDFFYKTLFSLKNKINDNFMKYFVGDRLCNDNAGTRGSLETCRGDSAGTYIASSEAVKNIIKYTQENYSDFPLKWIVAKNCRDIEIKKL
jgi:penicillin-binding protein-related factor A (putative recombinase)